MNLWSKLNGPSYILMLLAIMLLAGFLVTRFTKTLLLPNVSGYILAGIIIGPYVLKIIPREFVAELDFISDIALAFIAFGVGRFFKKETLLKTGKWVFIITLFESILAGIFITVSMYFIFGLSLKLSLLLGAIGTATAPASTVMTINQYHAKGDFVYILLQVVALDDVVCLLVFSIVSSLIIALDSGSFAWFTIIQPILLNILTIFIGAIFGWILHLLLKSPKRSQDNRIILTVALLLGLSGFCATFDVSPLLACMTFGAIYINLTNDKELYHQLNIFTPPIMLLFFVVSAMNLDINVLRTFGIVGVAYFLIRIIGKYIGAYLGCYLVKASKEARNYLGVALIPQAGVSIGLAYLSRRMLPPDIGNLLMTIILASSILYELIGPASAKFALYKAGAIKL